MLAEADVTAPYNTNKVIQEEWLRNRDVAEGRKTKRVAREGDGHSLKKSALEIGGAVSAV
jgi:hypothetical protein